MAHETAVSLDDDGNKSSQRIRVTLSHWLWWLTVTAVLLAIHRQDMEVAFPQYETVARYMRVTGAVTLALCPVYALAVCGALLGLQRWLRNQPDFPSAPGHWILVCIGTFMIAHELANAVFEPTIWALFSSHPEFIYEHVWLSELLHALSLGVTAFVTVIAARKLLTSRFWCVAMLLATAASVMFLVADLRLAIFQSFSEIEMWLEDIAKLFLLVAGLMVLSGAIGERLRRVNRDLPHWLGVITSSLFVVQVLVNEYGLKYL